jgi:hypothetical protein
MGLMIVEETAAETFSLAVYDAEYFELFTLRQAYKHHEW